LEPLREIGSKITNISEDKVREIRFQDFLQASKKIRASVSPSSLLAYEKWNEEFGSLS